MRVVWFYCLSYKTNNYLSIKSLPITTKKSHKSIDCQINTDGTLNKYIDIRYVCIIFVKNA